MEQPPHPMPLGDDEGDYYRGDVSRRPPSAPRRADDDAEGVERR